MPWLSIFEWIGRLSLPLAVLALILGLFQYHLARKQTSRLESHSESLRTIAESLTTKYLGVFPDYLPHVTSIIDSSKNRLEIITANPTPAYFSSPPIWLNYAQAIQRKAMSGVSTKLICMTENHRKLRLSQQFPSTQQLWDEWTKENNHLLESFVRLRFQEADTEALNYEKFLGMLLETQNDLITESFVANGIPVEQVDQMVSVQTWIVDRESAVFAIQSRPQLTVSHGFYTSDPRFVTALSQMIELYS